MVISRSVRLAVVIASLALPPFSVAGTPAPSPKPLDPAVETGRAVPVPLKRPAAAGIGGAVQSNAISPEPCDVEGAVYDILPPLVGENGCGFSDQILLKEVGHSPTISLQPHARISCRLAGKITAWLAEDVAGVARRILGSDLTAIQTGPGYACRRRNNKPDGKLSEHALGTALDIAAFNLADGRTITVEDHWPEEGENSSFLRAVHQSACARFTTVLGPEADVYHLDHFHLDIGCHGKTCTYLICQ